jgi:hypothetical protein
MPARKEAAPLSRMPRALEPPRQYTGQKNTRSTLDRFGPRNDTPEESPDDMLENDINEELLSPDDVRQLEEEFSKWSLKQREWIPFEKIVPDVDMNLGQSRALDNVRVQRYVQDVRDNPKRAHWRTYW